MSTVERESVGFARAVLPLLREYTAKLSSQCELHRQRIEVYHQLTPDQHLFDTHREPGDEHYFAIQWNRKRNQSHHEQLKILVRIVEVFARRVSTVVTHGTPSDLDRLRLELRLSDMENELRVAQSLLDHERSLPSFL